MAHMGVSLFRCDHLVRFSTSRGPKQGSFVARKVLASCGATCSRIGGTEMVIRGPRHRDACGFQRGILVCESAPHPQHPNGHVYVSHVGSHVVDRHGGAS